METFTNTGQPDWDWWGRLWPAPGLTLQRLGLGQGEAVVEVGSGNGYFALPAAGVVAPAPVYAVDLDHAHLDELAHLADQQGLDTVETIEGDARELSTLLPEAVDVALVANTLHGVDDVGRLVTEAFAALSDGGRFVVVNWHDRPRSETTVGGEPRGPPTALRMSSEETVAAVQDALDAAVERRVELPPYHYGLVFER